MIFRPLALAAMLLPFPAIADDLVVVDAWVPAAPPTAMSHAAYVTLHNHGDAARVLTGASADGYKMTHLHESKESDGVATMAMLHQITIPAGGMLMMQPGGLHVMLMGPQNPVAEGESIALTLTFENGDTMMVDALVKQRDAES